MANANITYQIVVGNNNTSSIEQLIKIYSSVFEDADSHFFKERFKAHPKVVSVLAFDNDTLIGFKIGYPYNDDTFYSWVGGVLPNYRQQGIATELAIQQETIAKSQGYKKLRTKSMNQYKPMMILNLKRDFDIVMFYTNDKGQTKIVFEKELS